MVKKVVIKKTKYKTAAGRAIMQKGTNFFNKQRASNGEMVKNYSPVAKLIGKKKIANPMAVPKKIRPAHV